MSTTKTDPNTEGTGTTSDEVVDAGQTDGSETSAGKEGTENTSTDDAAAVAAKAAAEEKAKTEAEAAAAKAAAVVTPEETEEEDDEPLPGDTGEKKFTQSDVNKFVKTRLKTEKAKYDAKVTAAQDEVKTLKTELESYRKTALESAKAEFDKLPEEVRALAPAKLDDPEGVNTINAWLPNAKKLAEKLATPAKEEKPKPGNKSDFKPGSPAGADEKELAEKAKSHSIYKSF
jgi:Skp family chaperone for outer membrane proteins